MQLQAEPEAEWSQVENWRLLPIQHHALLKIQHHSIVFVPPITPPRAGIPLQAPDLNGFSALLPMPISSLLLASLPAFCD